MPAVLLLCRVQPTIGSNLIKSWPLPLNSGPRNDFYNEPGFAGEKWGTNAVQTAEDPWQEGRRAITVTGNNRLYAVEDINVRDWPEVRYHKFPVLDKEISFTVDLSQVNCGCNAAIYFVAMPAHGSGDPQNPAAYCDIQGYDQDIPACVELDLLEGNSKAIQTTLHTFRGHGVDGHSCNQDGCAANWGKTEDTAHLYGPSARDGIDSSRAFEVHASFRETVDWQPQHTVGALMDVSLSQTDDGGHSRNFKFFDGMAIGGSHAPGMQRKPISQADKKRTRDALISPGVALVVSLWTAEDLSWLDGGCEGWIAQGRGMCDLETTSFTISDLRISDVRPPPPPPKPSPPPPPPPQGPPGAIVVVGHYVPWGVAVALTAVAAWLVVGSARLGPKRVKHQQLVASLPRGSSRAQKVAPVPSAADGLDDD